MPIQIFLSGLPEIKPKKVLIDFLPNFSMPLLDFLYTYQNEVFSIVIKDRKLVEGYAILIDGTNALQLDDVNSKIVDGNTLVITAQVVGG